MNYLDIFARYITIGKFRIHIFLAFQFKSLDTFLAQKNSIKIFGTFQKFPKMTTVHRHSQPPRVPRAPIT